MAAPTLSTIRTKVRRLTRSPSTAQLTDSQIDDYINTFILYDFPEHLRLFSLRTTFSFYAEPYIDVYETNTSNTASPFYNFKNRYITVHPPAYVAGYQVLFTQSREQFYRIYPFLNSIAQVATGDGSNNSFSGTLPNVPVLRNNVLFSSIDLLNEGIVVTDDGLGNLFENGIDIGGINYVTGDFAFETSVSPASGVAVNSQTVPYVPAIPQAMLYFDDKFILRPVPDQPYKVDVEVYIRPTELIDSASQPDLEGYWQLFAYGAARKVFQDRMDTDSLAQIEPEFREQQLLVLRRTIVQNTNQRVATIYTEQTSLNGGYGPGGWGAPF